MERVDVATYEDALAGLCAIVNGSQAVAAYFLNDSIGAGLFHPFVQDPVGQCLLSRKFGVGVEDMS